MASTQMPLDDLASWTSKPWSRRPKYVRSVDTHSASSPATDKVSGRHASGVFGTAVSTSSSGESSSDSSVNPGESPICYDSHPAWVRRLLNSFEASSDLDEDIDPLPVLTWYIDHVDRAWCVQPRIVFLDFHNPDRWLDDLKYPWQQEMPLGEPVFVDMVLPQPPKYRYETHIADFILTTRPVQVSAFVSVFVYSADTVFDDSPSFHLWRAAGMLRPVETITRLLQIVPRCVQLVEDGYIISSDVGIEPDHPFAVHNGKSLQLEATPRSDPLVDAEAGSGSDTNVLLDITNLPSGSKLVKLLPTFQASSVGAPLSTSAVLSSSETNHFVYEDALVDTSHEVSLVQTDVVKLSPHTDDQDLLLQSFREGRAQPQPVLPPADVSDNTDSSGYTPSIASQHSSVGFPEDDPAMQDVYLYHRNGPPLRVLLHWTDYNTMMRSIARLFHADRGTVVDAYEIAVTLPDVPPGVAVAIVHFLQDINIGHDAKLVLVDLELHGNRVEPHFSTGPLVQRDVWVVPARITRNGLLAHLNVDQYCRLEQDRCLLYHNLVRWPDYNTVVRQIKHGDHFRVAIPPSDAYHCPTDQLLRFVQRGLSHDEIMDQLRIYGGEEGFSPSPLSPDAVRQLAVDTADTSDDAFQALQLSSNVQMVSRHFVQQRMPKRCSFTDEFIAAIRAAGTAVENDDDAIDGIFADEEVFSVFVQELRELWTTGIEQGRFLHDQPFRVESWFTDHIRHTRCHNSRITLLAQDAADWERQILATWEDRALDGVETGLLLFTLRRRI
eukprot:s918_g13.t1